MALSNQGPPPFRFRQDTLCLGNLRLLLSLASVIERETRKEDRYRRKGSRGPKAAAPEPFPLNGRLMLGCAPPLGFRTLGFSGRGAIEERRDLLESTWRPVARCPGGRRFCLVSPLQQRVQRHSLQQAAFLLPLELDRIHQAKPLLSIARLDFQPVREGAPLPNDALVTDIDPSLRLERHFRLGQQKISAARAELLDH